MTPPAHLLGAPAIAENLLKRKWSLTILRHLRNETLDATELTRHEEELSPSALNERLRTMLRYNLIERHPRSGRPRTVRYRITPKGRRILATLELISQLDEFPDQDPRTLEEIFHITLHPHSIPPPVLVHPGQPATNGTSTKKKNSKILVI
jgi:DNA-binding HxlR family transcriptional regulator